MRLLKVLVIVIFEEDGDDDDDDDDGDGDVDEGLETSSYLTNFTVCN